MSMIQDETLSKDEKIQLIKERISWIDDHEKMFHITSLMHLERELLKEELKELEDGHE